MTSVIKRYPDMRPMSADWYDIYKRYLGSAIWQERREEAMRTHGRYCKICRRKDSLEIHHESYVLDMFVDDNNVNEHMVLCRVCHEDLHKKRRRVEELYAPPKPTIDAPHVAPRLHHSAHSGILPTVDEKKLSPGIPPNGLVSK